MKALKVRCPYCGAEPGKPCTRYGGGTVIEEPHGTRELAAATEES